jgi:hypothetical protein
VTPIVTLDCELCIIGAGYAGLNGLNAAAKYLKPGDRVVFVDQGASWGGQWTGQYDFVRLHQPYRMFTAGDQKWTLDRDPSHLATRREILDHLASVPAVSAPHLEVKPLFGHAYSGHEVRDGRVELDAVPLGPQGSPVRIRARRLLDARGFDISLLGPFALSSDRVRSVGLADPVLSSPEFLDDPRPVYVIGSGKSAMDCALHVIQRGRERAVRVITGQGMWFFVRDTVYPRGIRRWYSGPLVNDVFLDVACRFDGVNEAELMRGFERRRMVHSVFPNPNNCRLGMLSLGERAEIRAGVAEALPGHLIDVEGLQMSIRSGSDLRRIEVEEGAWFVNCTSHLLDKGHRPLLSDGGLVCAPQIAMGFTGASAYFLTHLWYLDRLARVSDELYRVNLGVEPKLQLLPHVSLMVMANMALVSPHLPLSVIRRFEGDFGKWYPLHRQLPVLARVIARRRTVLERAERLLRTRFSDPTQSA